MKASLKQGTNPTEAVALVLRVQVPPDCRSGAMMPVYLPSSPSSVKGLDGCNVINVRIPDTATVGSILEVQFALDMTREQRKTLEMEVGTQSESELTCAAPVSIGGSGGYQTKDYECQEYESMYDSKSYQPAEYRSIYD